MITPCSTISSYATSPESGDAGGVAARDEPTITMSLLGRAKSDCASLAMRTLEERIAPSGSDRRKTKALDATALGAACADFLSALACDPVRPAFRPMAAGSFAGCPVSYRPFRRIVDRLAAGGFITIEQGKAAFRNEPGMVTRLRPTIRLSDYLAEHGIRVANRFDHFAYNLTPTTLPPLALKARSRRGPTWDKIPGKAMRVDYHHPRAGASARMVRDINLFAATQTTSLHQAPVFFRGYNCGDDPAFAYNKGGRLYARGISHQSIKSEKRADITINNEATVELDISACHITLAHALLSETMPNRDDVYDILDLPRDIVKMYVTAVLGAGKKPRRWSNDHKRSYNKDDLKALQADFRLSAVARIIMPQIPVLTKVLKVGLGWDRLQFAESEIVIAAVHALMSKHGVMVLPVHDSIIVQKSHYEIAHEVLSTTFYETTGIEPKITIKESKLTS